MKHILDSYDFCQWSLGEELNLDDFDVPHGSIYLPDLEELIEHTNE